jgi:hypothetical protein
LPARGSAPEFRRKVLPPMKLDQSEAHLERSSVTCQLETRSNIVHSIFYFPGF